MSLFEGERPDLKGNDLDSLQWHVGIVAGAIPAYPEKQFLAVSFLVDRLRFQRDCTIAFEFDNSGPCSHSSYLAVQRQGQYFGWRVGLWILCLFEKLSCSWQTISR